MAPSRRIRLPRLRYHNCSPCEVSFLATTGCVICSSHTGRQRGIFTHRRGRLILAHFLPMSVQQLNTAHRLRLRHASATSFWPRRYHILKTGISSAIPKASIQRILPSADHASLGSFVSTRTVSAYRRVHSCTAWRTHEFSDGNPYVIRFSRQLAWPTYRINPIHRLAL